MTDAPKCPITNVECCECVPGAPCAMRAEPATYRQLSKALCGKENATVDEMLRAVEQLKRRAEPENRVLTVEEAQNISCFSGGVWLEDKAGIVVLAHVSHTDAETGVCQIYTFFVKFQRVAEKYGKTWRCWLRKPTAEEMEREKWE